MYRSSIWGALPEISNGEPETQLICRGRWTKTTGGHGVLSRSGFCGSKALRVVHFPTGRPQGHYWGPRGAGKFLRSKVNHIKNFQTEKDKIIPSSPEMLISREMSFVKGANEVLYFDYDTLFWGMHRRPYLLFWYFWEVSTWRFPNAVVPLQASGMIASPPLQCCRKKCHSHMIWSQGWRFWIL